MDCARRFSWHGGIEAVTALARAAGFLSRINDHLLRVCKYAIISIVGVLAVILIVAVFYRYALNNAIAWSEEGSKYLMVWLTFLGAPIALRHAAHINIDLLVKLFPPRGRQAFYLGINLVIIATMGILFLKGWEFAELGARQVASSFNFSMVWMYVAVPVGSALTCLVAIELSLKALMGIADPSQGIDEDVAAIVDEVRE
ncbi:MAG: TRAP transporter small permease [Pseudomonadota bacterium]